jgi:predicted DNA-binding transcriptional regulator AlpA
LVFGLSRETRGVVYAKLAEFPENTRQRQAYQFLESDIDEWLDSGTLSSHTTEMIRRVTYSKAGLLCLSDLQIVSDVPFYERGRLLRVLSRIPTFVVKLDVDRKSDIEMLARYWGAGGRVDEVRALLKSMSEVGSGSKMDLSRILPGFARSRLFSFPFSARRSELESQDCFWTALNFFSETPVAFGSDGVNTRQWVAEHYVQLKESPRYGDVIMMMDQDNLAIHACVYLADNIVFTKNGKGAGSPWILMKMDDMMQGYLAHLRPRIRLHVIAYRLKGS